MILWYAGMTIMVIRYAFRDDRMDLRVLVLGALLPDLIDKPVGLVFYGTFHSTRLFAHSLLFAAAVMTVVVLSTRRGRPRKRWMPLAIGILTHLFLAFMWTDPETLWWPFLGWQFTPAGFSSASGYLASVLTDPVRWVGEAVGASYLIYLWRAAGMSDAASRRRFLTTGVVDVPIDRR